MPPAALAIGLTDCDGPIAEEFADPFQPPIKQFNERRQRFLEYKTVNRVNNLGAGQLGADGAQEAGLGTVEMNYIGVEFFY